MTTKIPPKNTRTKKAPLPKNTRTKQKAYKTLPWKYCECGCHQHELDAQGRHFTIYNDLRGNFIVAEGHNAKYSSNEPKKSLIEADKQVREWLKEDIGKIKADLKLLR